MERFDIVNLANGLKKQYKTSDPIKLAAIFGIQVCLHDQKACSFDAYTTKFEGYPTLIFINGQYTPLSQKVLCAHELGHCLLHEGFNTFGTTVSNISTEVEYEANLFAVALLFNQKDVNTPFTSMDNYSLKSLLDYNIKKKA